MSGRHISRRGAIANRSVNEIILRPNHPSRLTEPTTNNNLNERVVQATRYSTRKFRLYSPFSSEQFQQREIMSFRTYVCTFVWHLITNFEPILESLRAVNRE